MSIFSDLSQQILDPLIMMTGGAKVSYTLEHKPLGEQAMDQQGNAAAVEMLTRLCRACRAPTPISSA